MKGEEKKRKKSNLTLWWKTIFSTKPRLLFFFFELENCPWSHNLDPLPYIGIHKAMCWGREEEMKE